MLLNTLFILLGICSKSSHGHLSDNMGNVLEHLPPWRGHSSRGSIWPQPQYMHTASTQYTFDTSGKIFHYLSESYKCEILTEAFKRYGNLIKKLSTDQSRTMNSSKCNFSSVYVDLLSKCEDYPLPHQDMDETYYLKVTDTIVLTAPTVWGLLRGLETFSQLLYKTNYGAIVLNETSIVDYPRFKYRGVLLDTSRHYLPVDVILENLEAMAYNKFNVFHWHIVDFDSFPYVSDTFPDLSAKGAFDQLKIYTPADVHRVIEFARLRGIRVIPEFDTPGHTDSWGPGQPNLLTQCYNSKGVPDGTVGPINPTLLSTWVFLEALFKELRNIFREEYIHIGGDEVPFGCWKSNPQINTWMKKYNISGNYAKLEEYFINNVLNITSKLGFNNIVWQEVVDNGCEVNANTVVEVWKFNNQPMKHVAKFTAMGLKTIITAPWYLNRITLGEDWKNFYKFEPQNFDGTERQKKLVVGGEACMWGEFVDKTNLTPRLWPRASAVAERLWSNEKISDPVKAAPRLHEHRCTLLSRGIKAEPLHQGYCAN